MQARCLDWFPRLRAISLAQEDVESEQNEYRTLASQLDATQGLVKTLSAQLSELRDQMTEQRKQKQRIGLLNNAPSLLNLGLNNNNNNNSHSNNNHNAAGQHSGLQTSKSNGLLRHVTTAAAERIGLQ